MSDAYSNIEEIMPDETYDGWTSGFWGDVNKATTPMTMEDYTYTFIDPYTGEEMEPITIDAAEAARAGFGSSEKVGWWDEALVNTWREDDIDLIQATAEGRDEYAAHLFRQMLVDPTREGADEVIEHWMEVADAQLVYSENVLSVVRENNEGVVESYLQSANEIENEFDNMRQELFFGEKGNFTGALFKEMRTNGVENLLYKTEIMQTNNFYGLTMDDAVATIEESIVSRLQAAGVPVN
jgi:hypothetical protein